MVEPCNTSSKDVAPDLRWALERVKMFDSSKGLMPYQEGMIAMATEIERLTAGIKALQTTCCGNDPEKCHGCRALLALLAAPEPRDG